MKNEGKLRIDRSKFFTLAAALATAPSCGNYHVVATDAGVTPDDASADDAASQADARDSGGTETGPSCSGGKIACGASCVDTSNDPQHCGSCTKTCSTGGDCWNGQCCYPSAEGGWGGGVCVVYPTCGCPSGQMCTRKAAGLEQCVPNGTTPANGQCQDSYQCEPNFACTNGYCQPMCLASSNCATNWACLPQVNGATALGYSACDPHCNPLYPFTVDASHVACGTGQRCQMSYNAQGGTFCEASTGTGGQGAACPSMYGTACKAGYECVNYMGGGTYECVQYCRVGFSDCLTGSCVGFQTPAYDGTAQIGACE